MPYNVKGWKKHRKDQGQRGHKLESGQLSIGLSSEMMQKRYYRNATSNWELVAG